MLILYNPSTPISLLIFHVNMRVHVCVSMCLHVYVPNMHVQEHASGQTNAEENGSGRRRVRTNRYLSQHSQCRQLAEPAWRTSQHAHTLRTCYGWHSGGDVRGLAKARSSSEPSSQAVRRVSSSTKAKSCLKDTAGLWEFPIVFPPFFEKKILFYEGGRGLVLLSDVKNLEALSLLVRKCGPCLCN